METKVEVKAEKIRRRNRLESDILRHFFEGLFYFTPLFGAIYACWRAARLRSIIFETKMDVRSLIHDIGGYEYLFQLRDLKGYYGSYEHIKELLDERKLLDRRLEEYRKLNITEGEMDSIRLLRTYGALEIIPNRLLELQESEREIGELKGRNTDLNREHQKLLNDLADLRRELKSSEIKINNIFVDIGGAELIPHIKELRDEYGSLESIREKMEELSALKETLSKNSNISAEEMEVIGKLQKYGNPDLIVEKLHELDDVKHELSEVKGKESVMEKYNEKLMEELESARDQIDSLTEEMNKFYIDVGGRESIPQIRSLRDEYGSFGAIEKQMEELSALKSKSPKASTVSGEDAAIVVRLKQYGSPDLIVERLKELETVKEELSKVKGKESNSEKYNSKLLKEVDQYKKELTHSKKELKKLTEELNQFYIDIGGAEFIPQIKSLKNEYGSFKAIREKIEALSSIKIPDGKASKLSPEDIRAINQLKDELSNIKIKDSGAEKYNDKLAKELENYKREVTAVQKDLQKSNEELSQFYIDIGGKEFIPKIKKLRDGYGSFDKIKELLDRQKDLEKQLLESKNSREATSEDLKMIQQLKKYGSVPMIIERIGESDRSKKELNDLRSQKEKWEKDNKKLLDEISNLKKELEDKEIRLQKVFIDIGGKNLIKETKN